MLALPKSTRAQRCGRRARRDTGVLSQDVRAAVAQRRMATDRFPVEAVEERSPSSCTSRGRALILPARRVLLLQHAQLHLVVEPRFVEHGRPAAALLHKAQGGIEAERAGVIFPYP